MRKIKNLAISIFSFVFVIVVGLFAITTFGFNKSYRTQALTSVEYKETYNIGETVIIQPAEFEYLGKTYKANSVVRFPNGNSYKYEELLLKDPGNYYVNYSAIADDKTLLKETKAFTVLSDVYTLDGEGSYEYGTNAYLAKDVEGLNVTLGRNATFTINKPINVANLTKEDSILKLYATPANAGTAEIGVLYIRLTDIHDKNRFVEVQYRPMGSFQYIYASANGQLTTGLRQTSEPAKECVEYDGYYYKLSHNNTKKAGHVSRVSFTGAMDPNNTTNIVNKYFPDNAPYTAQDLFYHNALEIRMDYAEKRVYSQPDGVYSITRSILADFDDERSIGDKEAWEGFTTGEVFVSMYAKDYTSTAFNFFITDIYGQEVNETTMKNEVAPHLSVDTQGYAENNLPNAIVNKKYGLFSASAMDDIDGEVRTSVKVYNSIGQTLTVTDNSFIPTQAGVYRIEYSAVDAFENKAVKTFNVKAISRDALAYSFSAGGELFDAGQVVTVKTLTMLNASNLYELAIYARNADAGVEYLIDSNTLQFVPLYAGNYTITYVYTDYCSEEVISYDIVVENSDLAVFEDNVLLPKYIIKGIDYPVVQINGYTFVAETQKQEAVFYVKEENGEERLVEGDTYSVQGEATYVDLIYKLGEHQKSYRIPVVNATINKGGEYQIDLSKYFYNTVGSFKTVSDNKKVQFEVVGSQDGKASLEVINPARLINDFNIGFHFETGKTDFQGVKIVLVSAYDSNKTVSFTFEREVGTAAKVAVNGGNYFAESSISSKFKTPTIENDNFNITYISTTRQFNISGFSIDADKLLENFDDLFYINFELYGISGSSAINITRVVNQKITKDKYDGVQPVVMYGSFKGYYVVGEEVKINKIKVYDFVDPNPKCAVTMQIGAKYLTATNGVKLDGQENALDCEYFVEVTSISRMTFKVACEDFSWNSLNISLPLMVKDVVAPTIEVKVEKNVYKVGDTITVADYVAQDDSTAQDKLEVTYYLIGPDGSTKYLTFKSFTIEKAGMYTVYYIVRDEAGNNGYASYLIVVE